MPYFLKVNKSEVTVEDRVAFEKEWQEKQAERERERQEK